MARCKTQDCQNFAGNDGLCNACRRGEKPDSEKRKREEEAAAAQVKENKRKKLEKEQEYREKQKPCANCGGKEMLQLYNKAPDNNYATLPSGKEVEGSFPTLPGITHHEGVNLTVCVDCGMLAGFDTNAVKQALAEEEEEETED